ncbi:MAG: xanthine dehydrogenase family protein molybdopterin-binding subunit, partial [Acidimicrobiia bacterium]
MTAVIGTPMLRREDGPLLTGEARYVEDLAVPGALHMVIIRSPYAHARIRSVDVSAALTCPGVVAAYSGEDIRADFPAPLPMAWQVTSDLKMPENWPIATGKACFAGDRVAVVVAQTREAALDAAESVNVDYEELPAVIELEDAQSDRVVIHDALGTNVAYTWPLDPNPEGVAAAFASAAYTVKERFVQQRLIPTSIETRGVCVVPSPFGGDLTIYSSTQIPHLLRTLLGLVSGVPEHKIRAVAPSVGGGFGGKLNVFGEEVIAVILAQKLKKPVRWVEERTENSTATIHGRGQIQDIEVAADENGKITAVRVSLIADMGAYLQLLTPGIPLLGGFLYTGIYAIPNYAFTCTGVYTNKVPTDAYRGAGRPEACYAIERCIETLARQAGLDPAEIRRRNFIPTDAFPFTTAAGLIFDSGNYEPALEQSLDLAGYDQIRKEQAERRAAGSSKHLGVGLSTYTEICGIAPSKVLGALNFTGGGWEAATVRMMATGKVQVVTGSTPHGQGHETCWSQIAADRLGISTDDVDVLHSDTAISPLGLDTYGSRSLAVGGTAVWVAIDKVIAKAKTIAAHQLEVSPDDLEFEAGAFTVKGSPEKTLPIQAIAFAAFQAHNLPEGVEPNLEAQASWDPPNFTFPFGAHVCVVEVDEETGQVDLLKYVAVDDCGNQVNPMIVEGQVHGGIAQG